LALDFNLSAVDYRWGSALTGHDLEKAEVGREAFGGFESVSVIRRLETVVNRIHNQIENEEDRE
jgi:hypothetical protein